MADFNVDFSQAEPMNVSFRSESFECDFGEGIPVGDYEGPYQVTPTEEVQILPTENKTVEQNIEVNAIPEDYIGSGIERRSQGDLVASGDTVEVSSGYYAEGVSKSVPHGSAKSAEGTVSVNPSISVDANGLIRAEVNKSLTLTPTVVPGYVEHGESGILVAQGSATQQLTKRTSEDLTASGRKVTAPAGYYPESASKDIQESLQHIQVSVDENGLITATEIVSRAGYRAAGSMAATSQLETLGAATFSPSEQDQTIPSGKYLTGQQTIKGMTLQEKNVNVNGSVQADEGFDALKKVNVNVPYTWQGANTELVEADYYTWSGTLNDTTYSSWTPGTSATSILATTNAKTFVADMTKYEYMLEWLWDVETAWPSGQTMSYCPMRNYGAMYQVVMRRPYGLQNFADDNWAYNYCTNDYTASGYLIYYNSSKNLTWTTTQYGVYVSALTAAGLSSTSSNSPTITPKRPVVSARCNSSYFTTTRAGQVDKANTTIKIKMNLYRMDINTSNLHFMWRKAIDMYNNPL